MSAAATYPYQGRCLKENGPETPSFPPRFRSQDGRRTAQKRKWRVTPEAEVFDLIATDCHSVGGTTEELPSPSGRNKRGGMEAPSLSALPDSILLQILELLPPRDRLGGARVCRRWHRLVRDKLLWRHLDLTPYKMSSKALWHLLRNHLRGNLRTLRARGCLHSVRKQEVLSPALMQALGKQCPNFHRLCLSETDLRALPYDCMPPSLTTLELSRCEIPSVWFQGPGSSQAFPRIQHLVIQNVPAFSNQHLANIARQGTLKTLVVSEAYRVTDGGIQATAPHLGELESLALRQCCVGDLATHFIGRHMKRLRLLDLSGGSSLTDTCLPCFSSLASLEVLRLEACCGLSPEAIAATCRALPRLKHLDVSKVGFDERTVHQIQAGLPNCVVTCSASGRVAKVKT
ncbi:PREDICTED: F-box/LRR-repeat protein 12 [Gekko japonicus]|uniref:F-box/LRR-repeat protein 12 n=1 Tax=Gekko japonicus TaxID=146911 RepID=A0ABM1LB99_GEKJA|nr:PREDICTED: F-box/LRR-repeat protein 12 [Gekko japonicus]